MAIPAPEFSVEEILHVLEIVSILGGGLAFAYKMGGFAQAINDANQNFIDKMEESKEDRAQIHQELRAISDLVGSQRVTDSRLDSIGDRMNKLEQWYDELRRGKGYIVSSSDRP